MSFLESGRERDKGKRRKKKRKKKEKRFISTKGKEPEETLIS